MKVKGFNNELHPGITMHKIPVKAGFPGLVFTIGMLAVFLMGIPALIYFLVFATVLGIGFAVMLHFIPRQAGLVALVFTAAMLVWLAVIPGMDDWRREQEIDRKDLLPVTMAPPPQYGREIAPARYDCGQGQSKQPHSTTQRDREGQKRPQPQSSFDGIWVCEMNDLPGVNLIVADAGGGQLGGVVTFYLQMRGDEGEWRVADKFVAPLLAAHATDKSLIFEVQHHKTHGSSEFGANVKFRMELTGSNGAFLYNLSKPFLGPSRLTRQG